VPNFLILDQPSQVYFPSREVYESLENITAEETRNNADILAVERMFNLLFDFCESQSPKFQIIVLEHANLDDARFQAALVESPWRDRLALITDEFLSD
jgi:hypothetical protein